MIVKEIHGYNFNDTKGGLILKIYYIDITDDLTSFEFYNNLLDKIKMLRFYNDIEGIVLDFSRTYKVEPLVIPNLLCLGYIIRVLFKVTPVIRIPDTSTAGPLKKYLDSIGFISLAKKYNLYEFESSPYGGMEGKTIDPLCATLFFNSAESIDNITRGVEYYIKPFTEEYLGNFNIGLIQSFYNEQYNSYSNEITQFLQEIILNCQKHARSFSFTTLHAKHSNKMIYISVSDCGCGFLKSILNRNDESNQLMKNPENELQAIMIGVYKRKDSKIYGLYNVIKRTIELNGKVRIHSNNTQVIFTPRIKIDFTNQNLLSNQKFYKYNVKDNIEFAGVHIEIEIPFI